MRHPRPVVVALVLLLATGGVTGCRSLPRASGADVLRADAARIEAMVRAEPERLAALLHDDLTYAHSNGKVDSKASLLELLGSGWLDYRVVRPHGTRARVHGPSAIVTGAAHIEVSAGGKLHVLENLYTATYWWEGGVWRLAAYHSGRLDPDPPTP